MTTAPAAPRLGSPSDPISDNPYAVKCLFGDDHFAHSGRYQLVLPDGSLDLGLL